MLDRASTPVPVVFDCEGSRLTGIIDRPNSEKESSHRGVVIVVGGPQYRVGSHRQFVLLARELADNGFPTLRFDQRGVGDSEGATDFEHLDADIRAAVGVLMAEQPQLTEVVLWGLCDAASAIMMYAHKDDRVAGAVLLNPWVRDDRTIAQTYIRNYYSKRLLSTDFWRKLLTGGVDVRGSLGDLAGKLRSATAKEPASGPAVESTSNLAETGAATGTGFQERMTSGWSAFSRPSLLVLSGNDLTADEFKNFMAQTRSRRRLLKRKAISACELSQADHTFASAEWRAEVGRATADWLRSF